MMYLFKRYLIPTYFYSLSWQPLKGTRCTKIKTAARRSIYWGEAEKSKSDSSYRKKCWLLKLSCSVTYCELDHYLAQDCNKLSDLLLPK